MNILRLFILLISIMMLSACGSGDDSDDSASLENIQLSVGSLDQIFQSNQYGYTATVSFLTKSLYVTATAKDADASIRVNGVLTPSGQATAAIDLLPNTHQITINVINGESSRDYTVDVSRQNLQSFAQQAYVKSSNTDEDDNFGTNIAVSGNTMAVGAPYEDSASVGINQNDADNTAEDSGAVYVFVKNNNIWQQQAYIKASNTDYDDLFGTSVALSGDTLVVGAKGESSGAVGINGDETDNSTSDAGAVYVFIRHGIEWSQQAYLKASDSDRGDRFGVSVAVEGDRLAVGSLVEAGSGTGVNPMQNDDASGAGAVYIFNRVENVWNQQAYIKASNTNALDFFGHTVALSGNTLAVSAIGESSNAVGINQDQENNDAPVSGAVYVFVYSNDVWVQQAYIKASNTEEFDRFGFSLALSGNSLAVGALEEDSNARGINQDDTNNDGLHSGAVYLFTRSNELWSQQAYLKASNTDRNDSFGASVSLLGDTLAVGASREASVSIGINQDEANNDASESGAVYLYTRSANEWSQQAYIKSSNTDLDSEDNFGYSVALTADTLAVGAVYEASDATGVNQDQLNDNAYDAGAVYVFY